MGDVTVLVGHDWVPVVELTGPFDDEVSNVVADARSEYGMVLDTMPCNGSYSWYNARKSTTPPIEYISESLGKSSTDHCESVLA